MLTLKPDPIDPLLSIEPKRLAVKLHTAGEKVVRQGHPWVFESAIKKCSVEGSDGDLAIIFDQKKNKFLALGLYDSSSPIRIKVIQAHTQAILNEPWFIEKIKNALTIRQPLIDGQTNSFRLLFGENDGLPGIIADVFANTLVLKLYTPIWIPYFHFLLSALENVYPTDNIVLRLSRNMQKYKNMPPVLTDGRVLKGNLPEKEVVFLEHGLLFSANVIAGHKTGFFLDHRHNRKRIGELSHKKTVLDVFSYSGGFTVHALAGGAQKVVSLDISKQALDAARKNVFRNFAEAPHEILACDAFQGLKNLNNSSQTFDLVIVDPPSFAKAESEKHKALAAYKRLANLSAPLVTRGGLLMCASCSSRVTASEFYESVLAEMNSSGRPFQILEKTGHDIDHPVAFPEGTYLKAIYLRLD